MLTDARSFASSASRSGQTVTKGYGSIGRAMERVVERSNERRVQSVQCEH